MYYLKLFNLFSFSTVYNALDLVWRTWAWMNETQLLTLNLVGKTHGYTDSPVWLVSQQCQILNPMRQAIRKGSTNWWQNNYQLFLTNVAHFQRGWFLTLLLECSPRFFVATLNFRLNDLKFWIKWFEISSRVLISTCFLKISYVKINGQVII